MTHKINPHQIAHIRESECIGCTKCIQACPVDAIIGASKLMHTILQDICTGCELCIPPCPVDCIEMIPSSRKIDFAAFETSTHIRIEKKNQRPKTVEEDDSVEAPPSLETRKAEIAEMMRRRQ